MGLGKNPHGQKHLRQNPHGRKHLQQNLPTDKNPLGQKPPRESNFVVKVRGSTVAAKIIILKGYHILSCRYSRLLLAKCQTKFQVIVLTVTWDMANTQ